MPNERGASLIVLLLAFVILGLGLWLLISRTAENRVDAFAAAGVPLDETRRQRTLADMRAIGQANELMRADTGSYAATLAGLEAGQYLASVPSTDAWGNPWVYARENGGFRLTSLGADGMPGPSPPLPWTMGAYACDLIMRSGQMVQAPAAR